MEDMLQIESTLTFEINELTFLRQVIDLATISAKDAKFVASIQTKIERELQQIQDLQNQHEADKRRQLEEIKSSSRKKQMSAV